MNREATLRRITESVVVLTSYACYSDIFGLLYEGDMRIAVLMSIKKQSNFTSGMCFVHYSAYTNVLEYDQGLRAGMRDYTVSYLMCQMRSNEYDMESKHGITRACTLNLNIFLNSQGR